MKDSWFTLEQIDSRTFVLSEYGHWEQVHSYLFLGEESAALIDTGLGIGEIRTVTDGLTSLPVRVVTTHCHWDHIGGHGLFDHRIVHTLEKTWMKEGIPLPLKVIRDNLMKHPFTAEPPASFRPEEYTPFRGAPEGTVEHGDIIDLGGRTLRVLHTPGHSPGHICLYEEETGYLVTGDLFYRGTIYANYPTTSPTDYGRSLRRISRLPGHNELPVPPEDLHAFCAFILSAEETEGLYHGRGLLTMGGYSLLL